MTKICEQCGETFSYVNPAQRYCDHNCVRKAHRKREAAKRPVMKLVCAHCDQPFTAANNNPRYKYCSSLCARRAYRENNREYLKLLSDKTRYGEALEILKQQLWKSQRGCCYLCQGELKSIESSHLDHDHRCCPTAYSCVKCRRGLACYACNHIIGRVNDDVNLLRIIADNLEYARYKVSVNLGNTETLLSRKLYSLRGSNPHF